MSCLKLVLAVLALFHHVIAQSKHILAPGRAWDSHFLLNNLGPPLYLIVNGV